MTGCPHFYSEFVGRSIVVVPVLETGIIAILSNIDWVMLILKVFISNPSSNYGFLSIGWNFCHIFSGTVIIAVVLLLAAVFFIRIRE